MVMQYVPDEEETIPETPLPEAIPEAPPLDVLPALETKNVVTSASVVGLANKIALLVNVAAAVHAEKVQSLKNKAANDKAQARRYESDAKRMKEAAKLALQRAKAYEHDAKLAEKEKVKDIQAQPIVDRLRKHKAVQYVRMSTAGALVVYLKPLWVDAQISERDKATARTFIGCYRLIFTPGKNVSIKVANLTFRGSPGSSGTIHWSVDNQGWPCWGEWQGTVRELWQAGDLYGLITTMTAYISSTQHGAAYRRTYQFRDRRKEYITVRNARTNSERWEVDRYAIYNYSYTSSISEELHGLPGITKYYESYNSLYFLAPVNCYDYDYRNSGTIALPHPHRRGYNVHSHHVTYIPKDREHELLALIESVKELPESEQVEQLRAWGKAFLPTLRTPEGIKDALLAHLDQAEALDYKTVAQPLVIDASKIV